MKVSKIKKRRARCKHVLAILSNRIETLDLIREEICAPVGDFAEGPLELAVVRWHGLEVLIPIESVVFLRKVRPEPKWIREARAKVEKELASVLHSRVQRRQCTRR